MSGTVAIKILAGYLDGYYGEPSEVLVGTMRSFEGNLLFTPTGTNDTFIITDPQQVRYMRNVSRGLYEGDPVYTYRNYVPRARRGGTRRRQRKLRNKRKTRR